MIEIIHGLLSLSDHVTLSSLYHTVLPRHASVILSHRLVLTTHVLLNSARFWFFRQSFLATKDRGFLELRVSPLSSLFFNVRNKKYPLVHVFLSISLLLIKENLSLSSLFLGSRGMLHEDAFLCPTLIKRSPEEIPSRASHHPPLITLDKVHRAPANSLGNPNQKHSLSSQGVQS